MKSLGVNVLRQFIPLSVAISLICLLIYASLQQQIRVNNGNYPQVTMAYDLADKLNHSQTVDLSNKVKINQSLNPFVIIYDKNGQVLDSQADLNDQTPPLPEGMLYAKKGGFDDNRVTWQPRADVRIAAVIVPYNNGFVLVGRNMREIETQAKYALERVVFGWMIIMGASLFSVILVQAMFKNK